MGEVALVAKITHVPSMYLSEFDGPRKGSRQAAIDGHIEIARRCRELGVDTLIVFDTHWLVNAGYHINCAPHFKGLYTSNELPHFISNMPYEAPGNPALGQLLARVCNEYGVETLAHDSTTLAPEYGTLVPLRYMNADQHFKVISVLVSALEDGVSSGPLIGCCKKAGSLILNQPVTPVSREDHINPVWGSEVNNRSLCAGNFKTLVLAGIRCACAVDHSQSFV